MQLRGRLRRLFSRGSMRLLSLPTVRCVSRLRQFGLIPQFASSSVSQYRRTCPSPALPSPTPSGHYFSVRGKPPGPSGHWTTY